MDFLLVFLGTIASCMAAFFSFLSFKISHFMAERARPCVGETFWTLRGDKLFGTLRIFPGQYFVQTKSIKVPCYKVSSVRTFYEGAKKSYLSNGEACDELFCGVSVPVNLDAVEIKICITPAPVEPFEVHVTMARDEKPLIYSVRDVIEGSDRSNPRTCPKSS